jgi:hypothetical protein
MSAAEQVARAINATGIAEVIKINESPTSLHIVHRVQAKQLSVWLAVVNYVLERKEGWDDHVCKRYFHQGGKIRYAWNFIAQWKNAKSKNQVLTQIAQLMEQAAREVPRANYQLDSYPLVGAKDDRNTPKAPRDPRAPGPMRGGLSQKGAHRL